MKRRLIWGLLALSILAACGDETTVGDTPTERLQVQPVEIGEVTRVINASGTVQPETTVLVGSEVSGRVLSVNVDFNTAVTAGDTLAVIDPQTFQNQVLQLEASELRDQAAIKTSEASINRATVNLTQNEQILDRRKDLYEQNATSLAQLEEAERSAGVSEADLAVSIAQLEGAEASLAQTRASLETARFNLSRTHIQSPIDGIVIERQIDPGQTVQASFSAPELFKIAADLSEIVVEAAIVESDVGGLSAGDSVEFTVDAYPNTPFRGEVKQLRLNSELRNNIVTYVAIVKAQNPEGLLLPGMTANLQITTDTKPGVLRIAADAERFRPTPEQIEAWQGGDQTTAEKVSLNEPVYRRLASIEADDALIASIRTELDASSAKVRETINDPTKVFQRTRSLQQLVNLTNLILSNNLDQREMQEYNALLAQENAVRSTNLWVRRPDGKMEVRPVKLGVSDGSFVEIIAGLEDGDRVVTGIGSARRAGQGDGGRAGGGDRSGRQGSRRPGAR
ncbi:MAG: efflux RND transporter periplasmic adaptor subunit [Hyphomonadaceae bacterium]